MNQKAYENALDTGKCVIRRSWVNTNSSKNQVTVQFQQMVERPTTDAQSAANALIALEQGTDALGTHTYVTALRSFNADKIKEVLGSMEVDLYESGDPVFANDLYRELGAPEDIELAIQVTENFEKNPYSKTQSPKVNPSTGEIVVATNPVTGTQMPVYRHTDLVLAANCKHTFVAGETRNADSAQSPVSFGITGEIAS
jgi:hypothetical protein